MSPALRGSLHRRIGRVDLLVVLPLSLGDPIFVGFDEYLELRDRMNDVLLELIEDPEIVGEHLLVAEISGDADARLSTLEALVSARKNTVADPE